MSDQIFLLAPPRIGGFDVAIPLLLQVVVCSPAMRVTCIAGNGETLSELERDPLLSYAFNTVVGGCYILRSKRKGWPYLPSVVRATLAIMRSSHPVLLHTGAANAGFSSLLAFLVRIFGGRVIRLPGSSAITLGREQKVNLITASDDTYLCFNTNEAEFARKRGYKEVCVVGFPRFYKAWCDHVAFHAGAMMAKELPAAARNRTERDIGLIFLGSTVAGIYEESELESWFSEVISILRRDHPDMVLLIKPHPKQNQSQLSRLEGLLNPNREAITHLHASALASLAKLAVSSSSSVILDILAMGTPVVLHQKFTSHWLEHHPEVSGYLHVGLPHSDDSEGLAQALKEVVSTEYVVPDIREILGHKMDLSCLLGHSKR